jgi:hypothetical protein
MKICDRDFIERSITHEKAVSTSSHLTGRIVYAHVKRIIKKDYFGHARREGMRRDLKRD